MLRPLAALRPSTASDMKARFVSGTGVEATRVGPTHTTPQYPTGTPQGHASVWARGRYTQCWAGGAQEVVVVESPSPAKQRQPTHGRHTGCKHPQNGRMQGQTHAANNTACRQHPHSQYNNTKGKQGQTNAKPESAKGKLKRAQACGDTGLTRVVTPKAAALGGGGTPCFSMVQRHRL
eukprot:7391861-Prymnesium_polylepis.1